VTVLDCTPSNKAAAGIASSLSAHITMMPSFSPPDLETKQIDAECDQSRRRSCLR
jgi:hypothetical protein